MPVTNRPSQKGDAMRARIQTLVAPLYRDEEGASLVEYILLVALIAMVCFIAMQLLGGTTSDKLTSIGGIISTLS